MTKFKKIFPYIVLFAALAISGAAAYYSVYGLSRLFAGAQASVIMMASALEFGKLVIASAFHLYWKLVDAKLKYYLLGALIVLIVITSGGIYGYLSDAYKQTADKDKVVQAKVNLLKKKKERFDLQLADYKKEKESINESVSKLRTSLSTDNQYQTVVKGQLVTQIQSTSKKGVQSQLDVSNIQLSDLTQKVDKLNDSISHYDLAILDFESRENISELGPLKYLSTLTGKPMDNIINWFLIMIMLVFDPLAIALVLLALFAFGQIAPPTKKPKGKVGRPKKIILPTVEEPVKVEIPIKPKRIRKPKAETLPDVRKFNIDVPDLDSKPFSIDEAVQTPPKTKVPQNANDAEINTLEENRETLTLVEFPAQAEKPAKVKPRPPRQTKVVDTSITQEVATHLKDTLDDKNKKKQ